jgi:hypothetical protein
LLIFYIALSALLPSQHKKSSRYFFLSSEEAVRTEKYQKQIPAGLFSVENKKVVM